MPIEKAKKESEPLENLPFIIVLLAVVLMPTITIVMVVRSWGRGNARLTEELRRDLERGGVITGRNSD